MRANTVILISILHCIYHKTACPLLFISPLAKSLRMHFIGSDYDEVGPRQKERKEATIKGQMMKFTSHVYSDTGLIPTNFILKSPVGGTIVDLGLCPSVPELQIPAAEEKTQEMTYLVMKHHISTKCYSDLAATFPTLPRMRKVYSLM